MLILILCLAVHISTQCQLDHISSSTGFSVGCYASNVPGSRSLAVSQANNNGAVVVYVSTRGSAVFAVIDQDGDGTSDRTVTALSSMTDPNGITWHQGDLYVAEVSTIYRYPNADVTVLAGNSLDGTGTVFFDDLPTNTHHGWKYIAISPDNFLYIPVGAPCNVCTHEDDPDSKFAKIFRVDLNGENLETVARGVRNTVGLDFHPQTGELWFTNNGADQLGNDQPDDTINRVSSPGQHFGFPWCHFTATGPPELRTAGTTALQALTDPTLNNNQGVKQCDQYTLGMSGMGPHVAGLGMMFYSGPTTEALIQNRESEGSTILAAEHGSWNRNVKIGYRVSVYHLNQGGTEVTHHGIFAEGWLDPVTKQNTGRPVDVKQLPDGSVIVSDDSLGQIVRFTAPAGSTTTDNNNSTTDNNSDSGDATSNDTSNNDNADNSNTGGSETTNNGNTSNNSGTSSSGSTTTTGTGSSNTNTNSPQQTSNTTPSGSSSTSGTVLVSGAVSIGPVSLFVLFSTVACLL